MPPPKTNDILDSEAILPTRLSNSLPGVRLSTWITTGHPSVAIPWATSAARFSAVWASMTKPTVMPSCLST